MALGTSSFTMVSELFKLTSGVWVALSIVLAGLFCMVISSSVAELASMYPSSPGIRTYLKVAFGNRASLLLVYLYLIFMILIAGVESYMFALVTTAIFPDISPMLVVLGLLAFVITTNMLGMELPRTMQILTAFVLITTIFGTGIYGLVTSTGDVTRITHPELVANLTVIHQIPAAAGLAVFLFIGFEWITPLGFGPGSYQRKIPLSMPAAILINIVAYSFLVVGFSAQLPKEVITAESIPQVPYFIQILGPNGIYVAAVLSVLAIFSTFNAGVMGGSRLIFILTREGNLPQWCAKISFRTGAPLGAISVLGGLAIISAIIVVTYELEAFAAIIGTTIVCFVYAAFMLAVHRLRKTQPETERPFRTPVYAFIQWFVIITMPAIGLMGLFSLPSFSPVIGLVGFVILAALLTRWSILRTEQQSAAQKSRAKTRELERSF